MYQNLNTYDGSLYQQHANSYNNTTFDGNRQNPFAGTNFDKGADDGIEYDYEIHDGSVVSSPGGVSTTNHHYTHGLYGRGNTSSDVYAGQSYRYISGAYGNLYDTGATSTDQLGYYPSAPDNQYWNNITPGSGQPYGSDFSPSIVPPETYPASDTVIPETQSHHIRENFSRTGGDPRATNSVNTTVPQPAPYTTPVSRHSERDSSFEYLSSPEDLKTQVEEAAAFYNSHSSKDLPKVTLVPRISPLILLGLFLLMFICFDLWAGTTTLFIKQNYHGGTEPSWKRSAVYAVIATIMTVFFIWVAGVPLTEFESL